MSAMSEGPTGCPVGRDGPSSKNGSGSQGELSSGDEFCPGGESDSVGQPPSPTYRPSEDSQLEGPKRLCPTRDWSKLDLLRSELQHDPEVVAQFVYDYVTMLPGRLSRIQEHVVIPDDEEAIVALLSLESSSEMLGESDLVLVAKALRDAIQNEQHQLLADGLQSVLDIGTATWERLGGYDHPENAPV